MKTKTSVLRENSDYSVLINAVINRVGLDSVEDVNRHGIDGGFSGFIYYEETHEFAMRHRKLIKQLLYKTAESLGENVLTLVKHFGVFGNDKMDREEEGDLFSYLGNGRPEPGRITNIMAWFAAEEVCRWFDE